MQQYVFYLSTKYNCDLKAGRFKDDRKGQWRVMAGNWRASLNRMNDALARKDPDPVGAAMPNELKEALRR